MAISNTSFLIKRSTTTATPTSLKAGELGYSYSSNNAFIGTSDGTGALPIGGYTTYTAVNNATNANTASTIVKRAADGSFGGQLFGNANSASSLLAPQNFSISGGDITASAQSFQGNNAVVLSASLNSVSGLVAGTYGSSTLIPIITVAANGRVMAIANSSSSISAVSSFTVTGNTGTSTFYTGNTLTVQGNGSGIVTTETSAGGSATISIGTDSTIVRSNTAGARQIITTDLQVTGNLTITGNTEYLNTVSLNISDPLIYLAANNYTSDLVDIGFAGNYFDGTTSRHTGFYRHAADNKMYAFYNYTPEPGDSNIIDPTHASFRTANVVANITGAKVFGLTSAIAVADGGTGNTAFTAGAILVGNGTGALTTLANTGTAGTYGAANYVPVLTTDAYGRVSGVSNTAIAIDASAITSGTLGYTRGGTGSNSYTTGTLIVAGATGLASLANSTYTATGTGAANNTVSSLTVDAYGRVTAATYSAISGLTVPQGGTGVSSFTTNGIVFGNGSGAMGVTALAGSGSDQTWSNQILTVTNAGVPVWSSTMDGGTF